MAEVVKADFLYFEPRCVLALGNDEVAFSPELMAHIETVKKPLPEYWVMGVDSKVLALEVRSTPKTTLGALQLLRPDGCPPSFKSAELVEWLKRMGVPNEVKVWWQGETATIVGTWGESAAQATEVSEQPVVAQAVEEAAPKPKVATPAADKDGIVSRVGGHQWTVSPYVNAEGKRLLVCRVCGMFMVNLNNRVIPKRPCHSGLYSDCYEIEGDLVRSIHGAFDENRIQTKLADMLRVEAAATGGAQA